MQIDNLKKSFFLLKFVHKDVHQAIMITTTLSDFRKDIKHYFDRVILNFETLIINRGRDNGIVIMSLAEYNSFLATQHELKSKRNQQRLDSAVEKLIAGDSFEQKLSDS
jgi:antitoxin YefM